MKKAGAPMEGEGRISGKSREKPGGIERYPSSNYIEWNCKQEYGAMFMQHLVTAETVRRPGPGATCHGFAGTRGRKGPELERTPSRIGRSAPHSSSSFSGSRRSSMTRFTKRAASAPSTAR